LYSYQKPFQTAKFDKIFQITTELDENERHGLLKLKIIEAKEVPTSLYAFYS
jgi:hypothetical protein